jgi:hypothetical protein
MDSQASHDKQYLQRYYAGQALIGLLSSGRLDSWLTGENEVDQGGLDKISKLAFDIGTAMMNEVSTIR